MHRGGLLEKRGRLLRGQRRQQPVLKQHAVECDRAASKACQGCLHTVCGPHCRPEQGEAAAS